MFKFLANILNELFPPACHHSWRKQLTTIWTTTYSHSLWSDALYTRQYTKDKLICEKCCEIKFIRKEI